MSFGHFLKTVKIQNPVSKVLYHFKEEKHKSFYFLLKISSTIAFL